jgi:predicted Zn-dependent protease
VPFKVLSRPLGSEGVMKLRFVISVTALTALLVSCATNPATGRRQLILMSEQEELALGKQSDAEIRQQMGVYADQALQDYVNRVGQRLARQSFRPNLPWTFTVVDEAAVNAFALPGGYIYVTRGILPFLRNEAELAGVLGHEVGHVDAKHSVDQYSKQMLAGGALAGASILLPKYQSAFGAGGIVAQLAFLKFGRDAELEADKLGVGYASGGGWAPQAMQGVLGTLGRLDAAQGSSRGIPNWAMTHPPAEDRVLRVQEAVATASSRGGTATNPEPYERVIDQIVIGDSREKGMVRGSEFVHPILRFSLRFPDSWEIVNGAEQVSASPGQQANAVMLLELSQNRGNPQQAARAEMSAAGFTEVSGDSGRINGLDAYIGTYEGAVNQTRVVALSAHIRSGQQMYVVAGLTTASGFSQLERTFANAIQSFRQLSAAEAERIQPNRLGWYVVRSGDSWESIARQARTATPMKASTLAIMNGSDPGTSPRPGARVRVVVGG